MVYFIEGRSGTGKTMYAMNVLCELAKKGENKLLYIIPEQSSFECETEFLHLLGANLSRKISVMSFTRLYDMVMRQTGFVTGIPIDDGVRSILMSLSLEDCCDNLEIYKKQAIKPQMTELMLSAVKEFKMCGISTKKLREKAENTKGTDLYEKLKEVALVTDVYNAHIARSYIDPLDNYARLEERLREVKFFEGYTVVVDDFSGFTAQEQKILDLIMQQSKDFYITLCMQPKGEDELFFTVNRTRKNILRSAARYGLTVAAPIRLYDNHRIKSRELSLIEQRLYRVGVFENECLEIPDGDAVIAEASDIFEECEYVSERINSMVLDGECRYKDIAVVCRNTDSYKGILDTAFERHKIPFFMSAAEPVDQKPLMLMVLSAFEYALNPSDSEKLFNIAKSGLVGIDGYETALLENYVYTWGLSGRNFGEIFELDPDGYSEKMSDDAKERLLLINKTREKLIFPLLHFIEKINDDDADALLISKAVYELLEEYNVPEFLKNDVENNILDELSNEEARIWEILMGVLDKMYLSLGERRVSVKRYYELLKMLIRSYDISEIPQTLDQVLVGAANSVRLSEPYAVFVIGAVNGEFPHNPVSGGVFNDSERRCLIGMELPMYDAVAELFLQEKFFVYNAVSAPRKKLYVTYPTGDLSGGKLQPSSIVSEICKIIPNVQTDIVSLMPVMDRIQSEKGAFEKCAARYRFKDALSMALKDYFRKKEEYSDRLKSIESVIRKSDMKLDNQKAAAAIFGHDKNLSASQIERFYTCRFQYFLQYGLKLKDRRRAELGAIEYGSLMHYLLENVVKAYRDNDYVKLADDELEALLDELLKDYIMQFMGGEDGKSDRFKYLYYRLKHSTQALIGHLSDELSQSEFKPVDFELGINDEGIGEYTVIDGNGNLVKVRGVIDRVDLMKTAKASYIRIVDYKTGKKEFKLSDVLFGLNMQMLIYLSAIVKNGRDKYGDDIHPSGVLYMPSTVASVTVPPYADEKAVMEEHDKKLRMSGIVLDELQVLRGMEENLEGKYIPVSVGKDGDIKKTCKNYVISNTQLNMIFNKVERKISEMSEQLDAGNISAVPTANDSFDPCVWCFCRDVCSHEDKDIINCLERFDNEEVIERIRQEQNSGEDE